MKVAIITPIKYLSALAGQGDLHLVLAQIALKSKTYRDFYASQVAYKILDNGAFEEGKAVALERILEVAKQIQANEIVLPDVPLNGGETLNATCKALNSIRKNGLIASYNYMGVPQGVTLEEWLRCLKAMMQIPEISTIGLSKLSIPVIMEKDLTTSRLSITNLISATYSKNEIGEKQWHLLGGSNSIIREIQDQASFIRSIDSSAPFWYGKLGFSLEDSTTPHFKTGLDFYDTITSLRRMTLIQQNITSVLEAAHGNRPTKSTEVAKA